MDTLPRDNACERLSCPNVLQNAQIAAAADDFCSHSSRSSINGAIAHTPRCCYRQNRHYMLLLIVIAVWAISPNTVVACGPGRGIGGRRNRPLTPLVFKQHVPNMPEKTLGASGPCEGPIKRDSPRFKDLVPNYNKDIKFKDEEGTGADRLMSRRCKEKLNNLATSVMNQWTGVRLRVTEAWDEDNFHGPDSLHYEGRAVDITTDDRDRTKYGMLARLAVEAGFDWVYYASRAHIYCSVKSDSSTISHVHGCFTPESTVLTSNGVRKAMRDLTIGDRVLSMNAQGDAVYSEVILFMDRNLELIEDFVQMRIDGGAVLTVTPSHLVLVWNAKKQLLDYVFADRIEQNDYVLVHDEHNELRPQRVIELKVLHSKGVVAPLTREGTIVVNSVAASCYAVVNSQKLAHWGLAPMRWWSTIKSWLPSKQQLRTQRSDGATTTAQNQNGVHWYAKALNGLKDYVLPRSWRYQ